jgi:serine/threonine-protein kinase
MAQGVPHVGGWMVFEGRPDLSGRTIAGRYELRDVLGRGGMATVYRAYQQALDRQVAVKIMAANLAHDPDFVERFRREARTVARLRHPNILTVHDFGEEDGLLYLVTELIAGGTLQSRLHELRSSDRAVELIAQVGAALDYAHAQGIIHRDVKPLNIFLDHRGDSDEGEQAILADFGIAKATAETTGGLTGEGLSIGTPEYMAPEQLTGQPIDGRADLYALAVIAYQLLTGRLPIARGGPHDTPIALAMRKVQTAPPAPTTFNPHLPVAIDRVLLRALATEPQSRFATAADFVGALRAALAARSSTAPPRNPAASFTPQSPTWDYPPVTNQAIPVPAYQPAPPRTPEPRPAAAYVPVPQTLPAGGAPWAAPVIVAPNPPPPLVSRRSWLPIAGILAATLVAVIFAGVFGRGLLARAGVGVTSTATATARPAGTIAAVGGSARPTATTGASPTATAAATTVAVLPASPPLPTPSAAPTSTAIVVPTIAPIATPPTATAEPPTATPPPASPTPTAADLPTGTLLYSSDKEGAWAIYQLNPDGSGERRLTDLAANNYQGVWSPDGTQIAFVSERDNNPEIYLMNPDGTDQRRLTTDQGEHGSPAWGSDSRRVAYVLKTGGVEAVYYVDIATNARKGLINAPAGWPAWSSKDDIAWTRLESGFVTIYLSTVTGSASSRLPRPTAQSEDTPAFSPDGNFLAFAAGPKDDRQIVVSTAAGANRRAITTRGADNSNPVWSPDGAYIAYSSTASGTQQLVVMRNDGSEATTITTGAGKKWYLSWR